MFDVDLNLTIPRNGTRQSLPKFGRAKTSHYTICSSDNENSSYIAYVSEQNLLPDESGEPVRHPQVAETFDRDDSGLYRRRIQIIN